MRSTKGAAKAVRSRTGSMEDVRSAPDADMVHGSAARDTHTDSTGEREKQALEQPTPPAGYYWFGGVFMLLCVFAYTHDLGTRMYHHDEGSNYLFLPQVYMNGVFKYDPANYHGPLLFFLMKWWVRLNVWWQGYMPTDYALGASPVALRLIPVIGGLVMLMCVWHLVRHRIGWFGSLCALVLCGVNMEVFWISRYFIHEIFLVLFNLTLYISWTRYLDTRRAMYLVYASLSLAGMCITKEVWHYHVAVLLLADMFAKIAEFMLAAGSYNVFAAPLRAIVEEYINVLMEIGVRRWLDFLLIFFVPVLAFYSSFGMNPRGMLHILDGMSAWAHHGMSDEQGHGKRFGYFIVDILQSYSSTLWALGVYSFGLAMYLNRRTGLMLSFWTIGTVSIYSVAHYKTPWCAPSLIIPMVLLAGWGLDTSLSMLHTFSRFAHRRNSTYVAEEVDPAAQTMMASAQRKFKIVMVGLAILTALDTYAVYDLAFVRRDSTLYPHNYSQTFQGGKELVDLIEMCEKNVKVGKNLRLRAFLKTQAHPLGYYIRRYRNLVWFDEKEINSPSFNFDSNLAESADVILGAAGFQEALRQRTLPDVWARTHIKFSDSSTINVYLHRFRCQYQNGADMPMLTSPPELGPEEHQPKPTSMFSQGLLRAEWTTFPFFGTLDNADVSLANKLDLPDVERTSAIAWYSWLDVPMTGMYEIELIGQSQHWRLNLDQGLVVENSGIDAGYASWHYKPRRAVGMRYLEAGPHLLHMEFLNDQNRNSSMRVRWKQPHHNAKFKELDALLSWPQMDEL